MRFASIGAAGVLPLRGITDRGGHRIDLDYTAGGALTEVRHSGGYRIGVETTGGRITELCLRGTDPDVVLVRYGYDEHGHLSEVTNSSGDPLHFDYDDAGRLTGWRDRNSVAYHYTYDTAGNLRTVTRPDGSRALTEYNELHLPVTITTADGASWRRAYDEAGNLTAITDPVGGVTRTGHGWSSATTPSCAW